MFRKNCCADEFPVLSGAASINDASSRKSQVTHGLQRTVSPLWNRQEVMSRWPEKQRTDWTNLLDDWRMQQQWSVEICKKGSQQLKRTVWNARNAGESEHSKKDWNAVVQIKKKDGAIDALRWKKLRCGPFSNDEHNTAV